MRYNLAFISGDGGLIERLQIALSTDCALMPVDPRHEAGLSLVGRLEPNGIIVDAGVHPGARTVLESIAAIRALFPELPLIAIGNEMSAQMILASFRAGVDDFLDRESSDAEVRSAILTRLRDHAAKRGEGNSTFHFDVLSSGPCDEDFDLALNLATMLATEDRSRRVILLDLSLPASPLCPALGVETSLSISQAIGEMHRMDHAFFDTALAQSPESGVYLLPLADESGDMPVLPALNDLSVLLQVLRAMFDAVVVFWGSFSRQVLEGGDSARRRIFLCCNQRFSSIRNAKALLTELNAGGIGAHVVLAVHLLAPNMAPGAEDIVRAIGAERSVLLTTSWSSLAQAHNRGRPLSLEGESPYTGAVRAFLVSEGLLQAGAKVRAPRLMRWLRKAKVS
ncbi:MAG TPA: hypothetical protein VFS01_09950 [Rhizomicrobium sp.]|nr:hypothetical protein [Rhizomicrobium sp.]